MARVEGGVRGPEGTLTGSLVEDRALRVRLARDGGRGKEAITRYRVLERARGATVLELVLVTGRRGQLRAQLAAFGHPKEFNPWVAGSIAAHDVVRAVGRTIADDDPFDRSQCLGDNCLDCILNECHFVSCGCDENVRESRQRCRLRS